MDPTIARTVEVVTACLAHVRLTPADLTGLMATTHVALTTKGAPATAVEPIPE